MLLRGKPTQISEEIELPDIAELLSYPNFQDIDVHDVYKYGTDFHRKLIDMSPIDNTKTHITVHSAVKILVPGYRSCTGGVFSADEESFDTFKYNPDHEWHIDYEERWEGQEFNYWDEKNIITLLTNKTTAMTEFNENDIKLNFDPREVSYEEFAGFLNKNFAKGNPLKINPWTMPANRLVTFTNHLHRASEPTKIEFRYMFRLLQTYRQDPTTKFNPHEKSISTIMRANERLVAVEKDGGLIKVYYPNNFESYYKKYENKGSLQDNSCSNKGDQSNMAINKFKDYDFYFEDMPSTAPQPESKPIPQTASTCFLQAIGIVDIKVGEELISHAPELKSKVFNDNAIFFITDDNFNTAEQSRMFDEFFQKIDKEVNFISDDGETIKGLIAQQFSVKNETSNRKVTGLIAYLEGGKALPSNKEYSVKHDTKKNINVRFLKKIKV